MIFRINSNYFPKQHLTTSFCTLILVREHFHKQCPRSGLKSVIVIVVVVVVMIILFPEVYELNF